MRASRWLALVARAYSVGRPEVRVCPCVYLLFACACVVGACSAGKSQLRSFQRYRGLWGSGVVLRCRKHGSLTLPTRDGDARTFLEIIEQQM